MRSLSAFFLVLIVASGLRLSAQTADTVRATPNFVRNPAPVYPYAMLIEGREGSAEVQFTVEYAGRAIFASVVKSTAPEFGKALLAEIESNEFIPPRVNGQPKLSQASYSYTFRAATNLDPVAREILAELRKPMPAIAAADTLDKKPTPTRQDPPVYPYSLQSDGIAGRAEIEVVIDRTGRVLFPRVVSATNEDIGYAAAAAVARQRYQPPMKGGQPVHARMTVTVSYDKDKMAASW
jgi:TonB family protein